MLVYLLGIGASLGMLATVIELLRRGRMRERHAGWWLVLGVVALVNAAVPGLLGAVASGLGVEVPANLAFFVALVIIFFVALQLAGEITHAEERTRELVEKVAMLELRVRDLEAGARSDE